ncbi:hypothetical protein CF326_g3730 [Tilletia indica]|nr:hypothetical protein CF326_g3730 [Tilletia indica]
MNNRNSGARGSGGFVSALRWARELGVLGLGRDIRTFSAFAAPNPINLCALTSPWLPDVRIYDAKHHEWWLHHSGGKWYPLIDVGQQMTFLDQLLPLGMEHLRLDARVPGFSSTYEPLPFNMRFFDRWYASAALLARVCIPNLNLRSIHLRLPAQDEAFVCVESVLANNRRLTELVVEADFALPNLPRPEFHLSRTCRDDEEYTPLKTFIFRAPRARLICDQSGDFFKRLAEVEQLSLVVNAAWTWTSPWNMILSILKAVPKARQIEICLVADHSDGFAPDVGLEDAELPYLTDLILDVNKVDARLLSRIKAPILRSLRLRSGTEIGSEGNCQVNHFPSLKYLVVKAPGTLSGKCEALGIRPCFYRHNYSSSQNDEGIKEEMIAYIKPYIRTPGGASNVDMSDGSDALEPVKPLIRIAAAIPRSATASTPSGTVGSSSTDCSTPARADGPASKKRRTH